MSQNKEPLALIIIVAIFPFIQSAQAQSAIKKGVKGGIEFVDYFAANGGSISKEPGISLGGFTAINLHQAFQSAIVLDIELNYTRVVH